METPSLMFDFPQSLVLSLLTIKALVEELRSDFNSRNAYKIATGLDHQTMTLNGKWMWKLEPNTPS